MQSPNPKRNELKTPSLFMFAFLVVAIVSCCVKVNASDPVALSYGIVLAPGETLLAVDGVPVPVQSTPAFATPVRSTLSTLSHVVRSVQPVRTPVSVVRGAVQGSVAGWQQQRASACYVDANGNRVCPNHR